MSISPPKTSTLEPGYRLDRYELLCPIAEGGMASVWVARLQGKHGFEKLFAIKTILPQYSSDPRFQQMFLDEARIASGIEHSNVAQILDLGEQHDVLYIVMEFVDGDSLSKLHRAVERAKKERGRASDAGISPMGVWLRLMADTCGGLHAAHELADTSGVPLGVVHRDVSPQNILINTKGVAKLIDFGVAKARHRLVGETNSGNLKGKIQYMAPEQALGRQVDRRTDVWAIGAILYQLFSGRPPYEADNQLATLHLLASGRPPVPLGPEVPKPVAAIIRNALSHDPRQRYNTAADMQVAIESAMVEAGLQTTTQDVASFASALLIDRTAARRDALELALDAAAERVRMSGLLKPQTDSSSGVDGTNVDMDVARAVRAYVRKPSPSVADAATVAAPNSIDEILAAAPLTETSSATLASSALDNSQPAPIYRPEPKGRAVAIAAAFAGAGVVFLVAFSIVRLRGDETKSAAAAPQSAVVVVDPSTLSPVAPTLPPDSDPGVASPPATATIAPAVTPSARAPQPPVTSRVPAAPPPAVAVVRAKPAAPKPVPPPAAPPAPPKKKVIDDGF